MYWNGVNLMLLSGNTLRLKISHAVLFFLYTSWCVNRIEVGSCWFTQSFLQWWMLHSINNCRNATWKEPPETVWPSLSLAAGLRLVLRQVSHGFVQMSFKNLRRWRLCSLSGQVLLVLHWSLRVFVLPPLPHCPTWESQATAYGHFPLKYLVPLRSVWRVAVVFNSPSSIGKAAARWYLSLNYHSAPSLCSWVTRESGKLILCVGKSPE